MSPEERLIHINYIDMPNLFHLGRIWWDMDQINHIIRHRFNEVKKYRYGDIPKEFRLSSKIKHKKLFYGKDLGFKKWKKRTKEEKIKSLKCRAMTRKRILSGKIIKTSCCMCGEKTTDTHHLNYDSPYSVVFLCRKDHLYIHNKIDIINYLINTL